jgi:DNA transposition AAA+ family ATPase
MTPDDPNPQKPWIDKLAQEARILGEARMLRDEDPLTAEKTAAIVQRLGEYLARAGKSQTWAARSMGISEGTLSAVLSGTYTAPAQVEKHIRAIDRWCEQQIAREAAPKPAGFVRTSIVEKGYAVARWMQDIRGIAVMHGPAGLGKTKILQAIRADTPGSIYVRMTTAARSRLAVLSAVAAALRLTDLSASAHRIENQIYATLGPDSTRMILIDEAHKLAGRQKDEGLHVLRDIHDETHCPMLWAGTSDLADYIQGGKTKFERLDQLNRRIKYWLDLRDLAATWDGTSGGVYSIDDIRKIISAQKIRVTADALRYLHMVANEPAMGHLGTVCENLLLYAVKLAKGKEITAEMLRSIRREQLGEKAAEVFERQLELRVAASA